MNRLDHLSIIVIILIASLVLSKILFLNITLEDEPHTSTIRTDYIIKDGIIFPKETNPFNLTFCDNDGFCNHTIEELP